MVLLSSTLNTNHITLICFLSAIIHVLSTKSSTETRKRSKGHRAATHNISDSDDSGTEDGGLQVKRAPAVDMEPAITILDDNESSGNKGDCGSSSSQSSILLPSNREEVGICLEPHSDMIKDKPNVNNLIAKGGRQKQVMTRVKKSIRKEADEEKLKAREKKQQEKLLAKALKDIDREVMRSSKPQECLKSMRLAIDHHFSDVDGNEVLFNTLLDSEISYTVETNHIPLSIVWYRRVADVALVDGQVLKQERDQLESMLLLYISSFAFVNMVHASALKRKGKTTDEQTLCECLADIQAIFPQMKITCVTVGLDTYIKENRNGGSESENPVRNTERQSTKKVSKKDVDDAIVELHLQCFANYCPLNDMVQFGNLLTRYTKAVAEAPFKLEKQQQQKAFSWYAEADSSCPVKIDKDGKGSINLWQQQICQFTTIGKETAQAIAAKYPSPLLLFKAYKRCATEIEGQKLLQDIVVRRDYGPLATTRRVGPELSYKMYRLFSSTNGNELLQR